MITMSHYLTFSALLFCISIAGIFINRKDGVLIGGSDSRKDGLAIGY